MKKRFGTLSKREQERVEAQYHAKSAEEFDLLMTRAKRHSPDVIKVPARLATKLRIRAEREGKRDYEAMVLGWVEERIRKENRLARRSSKRRTEAKLPHTKRQVSK